MSIYAKVVVLGCMLALAACAVTPTREALSVQDADVGMVSACRFVGNVTGMSGWGGLASDAGIANAKNEARVKAARLGANAIVWASVQNSYLPTVSGNAYRCGAGTAPASPSRGTGT